MPVLRYLHNLSSLDGFAAVYLAVCCMFGCPVPLTRAAFFTGRQMIEKGRQVQPLAQLNPQVIEVLAAGEIERDLL
jgi:hypothetical protein